MSGSVGFGSSPSRTCRSVRHTPHAATASSTWPGPGSGREMSTARRGRRGTSSIMARICRYPRSEEHTSELQSRLHLVCRLLLEKKKKNEKTKLPMQRRIEQCDDGGQLTQMHHATPAGM